MAVADTRSRGVAAVVAGSMPVLHFDIVSTVVRDPFYDEVPSFFGMTHKELMECKHPTAWSEFEKGLIDEMKLARKFFKGGRSFDLEGLKNCMRGGYEYLQGIEKLLQVLKENGYEMHAFTNYSIWWEMIEDKLKISRKRKPDLEFYRDTMSCLKVDPASCVFIDDRLKNVVAAEEVGIVGLLFKGADS